MSSPDALSDTPDTLFAEAFKKARMASGQSQEQVASAMTGRGYSFHVSTIGKIERGDRKVTVGEAIALCDILGLTITSLVEGGQQELQSAFASSTVEKKRLLRSVESYMLALLQVAVAADTATVFGKHDKYWLSSELQNQSPAGLTIDAEIILQAAIKRHRVDPSGKYVKALIKAVTRDTDVLRALRIPNTLADWRQADGDR